MRVHWRPDATAVLRDERVRRSLRRYFEVMEDKSQAKFRIARKIAADFEDDDSEEGLWRLHRDLMAEYARLQETVDAGEKSLNALKTPEKSLLNLKVRIACKILEGCYFCVRDCRVNRAAGEKGFCRCGSKIAVSTLFEHMGEEPELVPSGTIFTLGCTMKCLHCQNWTISQWVEKGEVYPVERLAQAVKQLRRNGCRNANLVGGDPTPWLHQWLETFTHVEVNVPVVWNSNSYYSGETAELLTGFVDVYLLDFKYGSNSCAERISAAPKYWETSTRNLVEAKKHGELLIRVLILPQHLKCCFEPIISWIAEHLGPDIRINVMFQYRPEWKAGDIPELRRRLTKDEMAEAVSIAEKAGLTNFIT